MHDISYLEGNTLVHVRTGLPYGSSKTDPFKVNKGSLYINNDKCRIFSPFSFSDYTNYIISSIVIPSYIKEIGRCAFAGVVGLQQLKYMSNAAISRKAFFECINLKDVYIYGKVKEIDPTAFLIRNWHCYDYEEIVNKDITIHAKKDSYAHKYAIEYGLKFKELNKEDYCFKSFDNHFYYHLEGARRKEIREHNHKYKMKNINYEKNHEKFSKRLERNQPHLEFEKSIEMK